MYIDNYIRNMSSENMYVYRHVRNVCLSVCLSVCMYTYEFLNVHKYTSIPHISKYIHIRPFPAPEDLELFRS